VPNEESSGAALEVNVSQLFRPDAENPDADPIYDYAMRFAFGEKIAGRQADLSNKTKIIFKGNSLNNKACQLQISLLDKQANAYGGILEILPGKDEYILSIDKLKKVKPATLPRPYPTFLPYYFEGGTNIPLKMEDIEVLHLSIGPGIPKNALKDKHGIMIESIRLE
jgi:hypothetical protein